MKRPTLLVVVGVLVPLVALAALWLLGLAVDSRRAALDRLYDATCNEALTAAGHDPEHVRPPTYDRVCYPIFATMHVRPPLSEECMMALVSGGGFVGSPRSRTARLFCTILVPPWAWEKNR